MNIRTRLGESFPAIEHLYVAMSVGRPVSRRPSRKPPFPAERWQRKVREPVKANHATVKFAKKHGIPPVFPAFFSLAHSLRFILPRRIFADTRGGR